MSQIGRIFTWVPTEPQADRSAPSAIAAEANLTKGEAALTSVSHSLR